MFDYKNIIKNKQVKNNSSFTQIKQCNYVDTYYNCPKFYIGKTGRSLDIGLEEHQTSVFVNDPRGVVDRYCRDNDHGMNYSDCKVVHESNYFRERILIEGIIIDTCSTLSVTCIYENTHTKTSLSKVITFMY